jgi:hypothetical protein
LGDIDLADRHQFAVPLVILLDHLADFAAKQFIDAIKAAGHGGIKAEILNEDAMMIAEF